VPLKIADNIIMALAAICIVLLLYTTQLPQYGDSAIGTAIVLMVAMTTYVVMLCASVPILLVRIWKGTGFRTMAPTIGAVATPLALFLAILWWTEAMGI
jgi:hypothetical protein